MKNLKLIQILYLNLIIMLFSCEKQPEQPIRAMTFNIRLNVASDSLNAWPYRKDMAASMIQFYHTDIVGIQEALFDQVNDLAARLPDYGWFGVGRDDGKQQGEFMAIFYLKQRFTVLHHATFWLSETPEVPGLGWDAACNRIVTWGKFEDQLTGKIFYHFNTHFDHRGEIARQESARLLLNSIRQIAGNAAVIITGDFNSTPNSIPYQILTQKFEGKTGFKLIDTKAVSQNPHHGPNGTFTGFQFARLLVKNEPIDYIFISPGLKVLNHGILSDTFDGALPSDHFPVLAEIIIENRME